MPKGKSGIKRGGKGSSGKTSKVSIPVAGTIAEANALAVSLGLAKHADFTGLDVSVANEMMQAVADTRALYPDIEQLEFIGSCQNVYKFYNRRRRIPSDVDAFYYGGPNGHIAIGLNANNWNSQAIKANLYMQKRTETELWHPVGTGTLKGVIDHEIGHWIGHTTRANNDGEIMRLFRQYHERKETYFTLPNGEKVKGSPKMAGVLSRYANTSVHEFIAEAWTEYRNNPNPRPLAKEVGNIIESYLGGRH